MIARYYELARFYGGGFVFALSLSDMAKAAGHAHRIIEMEKNGSDG